ncbi:MAG: quinolinate synthase NadA [Oscillospiraceae bacterium]|jgi:quinolinate synthase|nr:quinolinate synthase NadA [Oscillospiraceae bacterium]
MTTTEIQALAERKDAFILAHYYQPMDIQRIAGAVGDSFELAKRATAAPQKTLIFCGVRFMAESAKLLSPDKTVVLPAADAGCPMADMVTPEDVRRLREKHPDAAVMAYVNTSAEVKAECDICCTSSSAEQVARSLREEEIIFLPDRNLGAYVAARAPEKRFILFEGHCPVHRRVAAADVRAAREARPGARVLVHPECLPEVVALADGVGSTSWILREVEQAPPGGQFVIGTEAGVVERLRETAPEQACFLLKAGFVCPNMKKTSLEDVARALNGKTPAVDLDGETMRRARVPLERMMRAGGQAALSQESVPDKSERPCVR